MRRPVLAVIAATVAVLAVPAVAMAHPLGNFTINHYAGVRVEPKAIRLDVVIDMAEIPTFQERLQFDTNGDGDVSDAEAAVGRVERCQSLTSALDLTVGGSKASLQLAAAGVSFPPGSGGLSTLRLVCEYVAPLASPLADSTAIRFADTSYHERIGWHEIVVSASGATIDSSSEPVATTGISERLTSYPSDRLKTPLDVRSVSFAASPGGPTIPRFVAPEAVAMPGFVDPVDSSSVDTAPAATGPAASAVAAVPGGVGGEIPDIFRAADLTPFVALASILIAIALGAGHAVTPGHGKTLMAAYLVGTRGRAVHAVGLGLSVSVSHTLGILVLAALVVGAEGVLPPDVVVRFAPIVAAVTTLGIGAWMLITEVRRRSARRRVASLATEHDHGHADDHAGHDHDHGGVEHSHGGVVHRHVPPAGSTISWRSLFVLGLAGGIIPSTNALLILLVSIAANRPAFGFVLVVAFGLGMAALMTGVGLAMVLGRGLLERAPSTTTFGRTAAVAPLVASIVVFGLGLWLTTQALGGAIVL